VTNKQENSKNVKTRTEYQSKILLELLRFNVRFPREKINRFNFISIASSKDFSKSINKKVMLLITLIISLREKKKAFQRPKSSFCWRRIVN